MLGAQCLGKFQRNGTSQYYQWECKFAYLWSGQFDFIYLKKLL